MNNNNNNNKRRKKGNIEKFVYFCLSNKVCFQPKSYEFGYAVKDEATGNDFGRRETSDGETVRGEYRVQLPDGRTQIVTYTADWRTGFHADVRYEGVATYPDQYNTNNNGYNNNAPSGYDYPGNNIDNSYNTGKSIFPLQTTNYVAIFPSKKFTLKTFSFQKSFSINSALQIQLSHTLSLSSFSTELNINLFCPKHSAKIVSKQIFLFRKKVAPKYFFMITKIRSKYFS